MAAAANKSVADGVAQARDEASPAAASSSVQYCSANGCKELLCSNVRPQNQTKKFDSFFGVVSLTVLPSFG